MLKGTSRAFDAKLRERMNHELYRAAAGHGTRLTTSPDTWPGFRTTTCAPVSGRPVAITWTRLTPSWSGTNSSAVSLLLNSTPPEPFGVERRADQNGYDVQISDKLLNEARRVSYKEVPTMNSWRWRACREHRTPLRPQNKLLANKRARTLDEARDLLVSSLKANCKVHDSAPDLNDQISGRVGEKVSEFVASPENRVHRRAD